MLSVCTLNHEALYDTVFQIGRIRGSENQGVAVEVAPMIVMSYFPFTEFCNPFCKLWFCGFRGSKSTPNLKLWLPFGHVGILKLAGYQPKEEVILVAEVFNPDNHEVVGLLIH